MIPILLALAFIAIILIAVVAGQPCEFTVSRSLKISAPPEKIFPHVNDLHKWEDWSPWAKGHFQRAGRRRRRGHALGR